jgi:hypothetical protein
MAVLMPDHVIVVSIGIPAGITDDIDAISRRTNRGAVKGANGARRLPKSADLRRICPCQAVDELRAAREHVEDVEGASCRAGDRDGDIDR